MDNMPFTNPENEYLENIDFCASYPDSLHFGFHASCKWKSSGLFSTTPAKANAVSEPGAKSCSVNKVVLLQFVFEELRISEGIE
ncbi:hypothetical protein CBS147353_1401 [Aspergillus niger]|nr:hypothetical protein CBS115988_2997 [Aspergillus niger]KAI2902887.1 hypothetical protein CBS11852_2023 [Aspergillus niger]KAI3085749.1 hypothetical protein CBS147353_1401 [Aspergillus niger]